MSMESGIGLMLLAASPLVAISSGIVVAVANRAHGKVVVAKPIAGGARVAPLERLTPMPAVGYVRIGYYRLKGGTADTVARRVQGEMQMLYGTDPGFIGLQLVRCGN